LNSLFTRSKRGWNFSKSSQTARLAISSAARLSTLLRTCRSSVMPPAPAAPCSSASSSSSLIASAEAAATTCVRRAAPYDPVALTKTDTPQVRVGDQGAQHTPARKCRDLPHVAGRDHVFQQIAVSPRIRRRCAPRAPSVRLCSPAQRSRPVPSVARRGLCH
jgi:hypothetical protein